MRRILVVIGLGFITSPLAAQSEASIKSAIATITPEEIVRRIAVIADDSMRGRATPSPEIEKTATFIAGEFRTFGLKPGGDSGRFVQRYGLKRTELDTLNSVITIAGGPTLKFPRDALTGSGMRDVSETGKVVVLRGTTINRDSAQALGLAGTVVLIPLGPGDATARNSALTGNFAAISAQGPAAVIFVTPVGDAQWQQQSRPSQSPRLSPAWHQDAPSVRFTPVFVVRDGSIRPVLARAGVDLGALQQSSGPVTAVPVEVTMSVTVTQRSVSAATAPNVVGIVEGADPILKNEYIVFSGHMDHVGVGTPDAKGDSIYNGADDDASGTIAVVQLAQAFAKLQPRPRRSLIFLAVSGEERGLWGSEYFALKPSVPVTRIVANLNADMVGRNWKDTIVAIGKEHSDLGATLNRVNAAHPELGMTAIDDIWPSEQFYRRSDHYNFAVKGVPILFFFNGTHEDYHRPGDEVSKIDGEKESRIVKLLFYLGLELANAAQKPQWNPESYRQVVKPPVP